MPDRIYQGRYICYGKTKAPTGKKFQVGDSVVVYDSVLKERRKLWCKEITEEGDFLFYYFS